jgi:hypothetical protein
MSLRHAAAVASLLCVLAPTVAADTVVHTLNGSGGRTTRPFVVGDEWELQWEARGGLFQAFLYDGGNGELVGIIANQPKDGPGATYQRKGGRYYLQINALGDWNLRVVQIDKPGK